MAIDAVDSTIGLVAVYGLVEVVKFLIKNRSKHVRCALDQAVATDVATIRKIVSKEDENGRKMVYLSKSFTEASERHIEIMRDISKNQKDTAQILSRLADKLDG